MDDENSVVVALDADGQEVWRKSLTSTDEKLRLWPDCDVHGPLIWLTALHGLPRALSVDGLPGDEIVVLAHDQGCSYQSCLLLLDPREGGRILNTFWHQGTLQGLTVEEDFFPNGGPAFFVWCINNKLDGYGEPSRPRPTPPSTAASQLRPTVC
jgi:hypothetical protein